MSHKLTNQNFQLIDSGWDKIIHEATTADRTELRVVCPFIKVRAAKRLLANKRPDLIHVVTRFHLGEMCDGFNDTEALRLLLDHGAKVRGVRNLHAKLYLFGNKRVIVTSANLTESALLRNHEFGFVSSEATIIECCREYFDTLWKHAGNDLDMARLEGWEKQIKGVRLEGSRPSTASGLSDEGVDAGLAQTEISIMPRVSEAPQSFVKLFGTHYDRESVNKSVLDMVKAAGCHWACTFRRNKRPRQVKDGAVMFIGMLVEKPNDTIIFGRAKGLGHVEGRDEASAEEIHRRRWKAKWPIYVRVHHAEFVAGTLENGIRLSTLMDELKSDSFVSTQKHAQNKNGNTNPRSACRLKAAMPLTNEAFAWLNQRLEQAFARHGKLTPAELEKLDWPKVRYSTPDEIKIVKATDA
jgi:HKD family nuclease